MKDIMTLGIDLAKHVFQLHGTDEQGKVVLKKRLSRAKLLPFIAQLPPCTIGMEACGGAHYFARKFTELGHTVKLMAPQYVKPYIKTNKNDPADAEGINEAVGRPSMRFVSNKTREQQDMQSAHRIRSLYVAQRIQLSNQIGGLLLEYGIVLNKGKKALSQLPQLLDAHEQALSPVCSQWILALYEQYKTLSKKINEQEKAIKQLITGNKAYEKLLSIPGIGPLNASALLAYLGTGETYKNGRQVSASLGLVPRQFSSGEQVRLGKISKRGDRYLRSLLVHGARSVVQNVEKKGDAYSLWIKQLLLRCSYNQVVVAVANKNARIVWAVLQTHQAFDPNKASDYINVDDLDWVTDERIAA